MPHDCPVGEQTVSWSYWHSPIGSQATLPTIPRLAAGAAQSADVSHGQTAAPGNGARLEEARPAEPALRARGARRRDAGLRQRKILEADPDPGRRRIVEERGHGRNDGVPLRLLGRDQVVHRARRVEHEVKVERQLFRLLGAGGAPRERVEGEARVGDGEGPPSLRRRPRRCRRCRRCRHRCRCSSAWPPSAPRFGKRSDCSTRSHHQTDRDRDGDENASLAG